MAEDRKTHTTNDNAGEMTAKTFHALCGGDVKNEQK